MVMVILAAVLTAATYALGWLHGRDVGRREGRRSTFFAGGLYYPRGRR